MSTLSVDYSTVAWTTVNFLIVLGLLHRFALPSLYQLIDENEKKRDQLVTDLEKKTAEADRLLTLYTDKMSQAEQEARQLVEKAAKEAEELSRSEKKRIAEEKQLALSGFALEMNQERQQLLASIKDNAADLIVSATKAVIHTELTLESHRQLIDERIERFEKLVSNGRR
ncbi:hypothetical protein EBZ35_02550 [bacterium]|nr:hypothetical protein [bacterium]